MTRGWFPFFSAGSKPGSHLIMLRRLLNLLRSETGATAVEYAVLLALIAGVCIGSVGVLSGAAAASFDDSATQLSGAFGS